VRKEFTTNSPEETLALGARIGAALKGGESLLLSGALGAGKTLLTKGIVEGMAPGASSGVASPSFTLVNIYNARLDIIHVDLYRLDSEEIGQLGLEDFMDEDHVMVVEWAERAHGFFTGDTVEITIVYLDEQSRKITIASDVPWIRL
jgi:tRNA threonylcarbamoyladenosine biosynthesis protein TsaE